MYVVKIPRSKFYQLVYFIDGKRTTVSTRTRNYRDAISFKNNFHFKEREKTQTKGSSICLTKLRDEYISYLEPTKSKSYIRSIVLAFKMLIEFTGDISLGEINIRLIDKFITSSFSRTQRGTSLYYRTLKAAFSKAVAWDYLSENIFKKVKVPKIPKSFPVFISEDELRIILTNTSNNFLKDIFTIAFYTGLRLGELINMKWSWLDFNQNQIVVKYSNEFITKSKKEKIVPMCEKVRMILLSRCNQKDHSINENLFYRIHGIALNADYVCKHFKRAVRASKLNEEIHFHTLRHSFASLLVQKGVSLYVVKELLGHESLTTTQIYSHLRQQNLREAVNLL